MDIDIALNAEDRCRRSVPAVEHTHNLVYVSDTDPGILRRRAGKGFYYVAGNERINDLEILKRIRSLTIPPAWTEVWICPTENGHIQATGRDQRGRKQYRYHPDWTEFRDALKFASLSHFAERLPKLRNRVDTDLRRKGVPREKVLAAIVLLLDKTLIRIGNDCYRRENRSFGLTTLAPRHVNADSSSVRFSFKGKSGRVWKVKLVDRRISRIISTMVDLPGQHLFQFLDGDNGFPIRSHDVNNYIREAIGDGFSSKHFRTWAATTLAAILFSATECPSQKSNRTRELNEIIDRVAHELRNTRSVCRKGYIHPAVVEAWESGELTPEFKEMRRRFRKPLTGLNREESLVLRWLQAQERRRIS